MGQYLLLDVLKDRFSFDSWPSLPENDGNSIVEEIPSMSYGDWVLDERDASVPGFVTDYIRSAQDRRRRVMIRYAVCADYREACDCLLKMLSVSSIPCFDRLSRFGLGVGDVGFGLRSAAEAQAGKFSVIWFLRFNVVVFARSIGSALLSVYDEAVFVDKWLLEQGRRGCSS